MSKKITYIIIVFSIFFLIGTKNSASQNNKTSNFISFHPSETKKTNGLGIKYDFGPNSNNNYKINGLGLGVGPLGIFMPFLTLIHAFEFQGTPFSEDYSKGNFNTVNGIDISLYNPHKTKINGVEINFSGGFGSVVNGVSLGLVNNHYEVKGLELGLLRNKSNKCRGVQIGLINKCNNLKGLQIGLWNINQTKSLPLINWVL